MATTLVICLLSAISFASAELEIVNQWSLLNYDIPYGFPTHKDYNPENTVSTGFEVGWERVFLSTPRLWPGNPATLGWFPRSKGDYSDASVVSPQLQAYPSWDWHAAAGSGNPGADNCTGLVSVYRVRADRCNRLWVLDSGVVDSLVTFETKCPPKILIFDLRNDQLVRSITFPSEVLRLNTLFTNIVLDDLNEDAAGGYGNCDNIFAYISDSTNPGILVYDSRNDRAWRLSHPAMFPDPDFGTYSVAGDSFTLMDGIIGLALSPPGTSTRRLYFEAFASDRIYTIPVSALRAGPNQGDDADLPVSLLGTKSSQSAPLAVDNRDGSLIFSPVSETAVASWVPGSTEHGVLAYSPELLQFPLDIRSVDRDSGTIWIITTRFQKFFKKTVSNKEINIRLMRITKPIDDVVRSLPNNSLLLKK
uniref:Protein yellow n=1 Tax=Cacopsylla melanoneura TaxID=428564 RepID=A0A8D8M2Z7_9HEMI